MDSRYNKQTNLRYLTTRYSNNDNNIEALELIVDLAPSVTENSTTDSEIEKIDFRFNLEERNRKGSSNPRDTSENEIDRSQNLTDNRGDNGKRQLFRQVYIKGFLNQGTW